MEQMKRDEKIYKTVKTRQIMSKDKKRGKIECKEDRKIKRV